jgi:tRNA threonylcarbamoyladenosine biosynthesis protein TsaE
MVLKSINMKKLCKNLDETKEFADRILSLAGEKNKKSDTATIIALTGDLGSGKTAMAKILGAKIGIKERIPSPTFVIEKRYTLPKGKEWKRVIHIDAYRLSKESELLRLGWNENIADRNNLIIIEWPENVKKIIPKGALWVRLSHRGENARLIETVK